AASIVRIDLAGEGTPELVVRSDREHLAVECGLRGVGESGESCLGGRDAREHRANRRKDGYPLLDRHGISPFAGGHGSLLSTESMRAAARHRFPRTLRAMVRYSDTSAGRAALARPAGVSGGRL